MLRSEFAWISPADVLGKVVELYFDAQKQAAEQLYQAQVLGSLASVSTALDQMYRELSLLAALLLDDINKLPLTLARGDMGGHLAIVRDSWTAWHHESKRALDLFWSGDALANRLITLSSQANPRLMYSIVADVLTVMLSQIQLARAAGHRLAVRDRGSAFRGYAGFFAEVQATGQGSLADRQHAVEHLRDLANANLALVTQVKQQQIGAIAVGGGFAPAAFEDCYQQPPDPNTGAPWRVHVYAWGGPDFTPSLDDKITDQMMAGYLRDAGMLPSLARILAEHGHDWPDQNALKAHAIAHQNAISISASLVKVVGMTISEIGQIASLASSSERLAKDGSVFG